MKDQLTIYFKGVAIGQEKFDWRNIRVPANMVMESDKIVSKVMLVNMLKVKGLVIDFVYRERGFSYASSLADLELRVARGAATTAIFSVHRMDERLKKGAHPILAELFEPKVEKKNRCPKCKGTGEYRKGSRVGKCFACDGTGEEKSSAIASLGTPNFAMTKEIK